MSEEFGAISPAPMKLMLMLKPTSKMSGPVPVGTAADSFCSCSRKLVLKTVHFTPGLACA